MSTNSTGKSTISYASVNGVVLRPRRGHGFWPFIIAGLLLAHVVGMVTLVTIAQRHKPPVVENYYQKAVNWDRDHADRGQ